MTQLINKALNLFGLELGRKSLLFLHMEEFTNSSWLTDIQKNGKIYRYYATNKPINEYPNNPWIK
jgi:hypothetical protein